MQPPRVLVTCAVLATTVAACGREESRAQEPAPNVVEQTVGELEGIAYSSRAEAERALEAQLDQMHDAIEDWTQAARTRGAQTRDEVVARLKEDETAVRGQLDELRRSSAEAWHGVSRETQVQVTRFSEQCRKLFEQR